MEYLIKLDNLGTPNKNVVDVGNLRLWFSYKTIVAFTHPSTGLMVSENVWSKTTGKLLNELMSDKKRRIPFGDFEAKLDALMSECGLVSENCKACGEPLYGRVRVHHHTDDKTGEDITS